MSSRPHPFSPSSLAPWLAEARALIALSIPLIMTQLAQMAMVTTDIMMVGRLGQDLLAAAALGSVLYIFAWLIGFGPASAVSPVVAHILGADPDNRTDVRGAVRMGLWLVLILSAPLYVILLFTEPLLRLTGQAPDLAADASRYVQILALGLPFVCSFIVLRNFVTALQRPRAPMLILALMVGLNFLGNYAFIFGHFGMPALGLVGSGVSTALVNALGCIALLAVILFGPAFKPYRLLSHFFVADRPHLKEISKLGASIGLAITFEVMLFNAAALMVGRFGASALAGHQIALNAAAISFMIPLGIGMAGTVRVGLAAGADDAGRVWRAGMTALVMGALFMGGCGILFALFPRQIAALYLPDEPESAAALALAIVYLRVAAAFQLFDGVQVIGINALRGLKDAHVPMWLAAASYWLVGFPLALILGFALGLEGLGVWIGLAISLAIAALTMVLRFIHVARQMNRSRPVHGAGAVL